MYPCPVCVVATMSDTSTFCGRLICLVFLQPKYICFGDLISSEKLSTDSREVQVIPRMLVYEF